MRYEIEGQEHQNTIIILYHIQHSRVTTAPACKFALSLTPKFVDRASIIMDTGSLIFNHRKGQIQIVL